MIHLLAHHAYIVVVAGVSFSSCVTLIVIVVVVVIIIITGRWIFVSTKPLSVALAEKSCLIFPPCHLYRLRQQ